MLSRLPRASRSWQLGAVFIAAFGVAALAVAVVAPAYQSLVWFAFYTAISNFFIPWLPHEPMVLLYGDLYAPWLIALVGGAATCWMEFFNYSLLRVLLNVRPIRELTQKRPYQIGERWFNKRPFPVLLLAGFSPIPYAPFRVFSVNSDYPRGRYLLAVFVGRTPRYYLLALTGEAISLPPWAYGIVFSLLVAIAVGRRIMGSWKKGLDSPEAVQGPT
ncbi:MAG: VTT domain-containing protein [Chloroflexi bacterium]|nr:VTT domain-containing protein [Chloroflexota bacterium]